MKKLFVILLALMLCFAGCSGEDEFVPERGKVENGIYKNSAFGISFSADESWYYFTDSEIAETMGFTAEELLSEDYANVLEEVEMIHDMYCVSESGATVNVNYENTGLVYGGIIDEETYVEVASEQLEAQVGGGIGLARNEIGTVEISGKEVPCLFVELELSGTKIYEVIAVKKVENWVGVITCASLWEEELSEIIEKISFE